MFQLFGTFFMLTAAVVTGNPTEAGCNCEVAADTEYGIICGVMGTADDGSSFARFLGVPYAKQPLGELRFKELQRVDPWEGYLNATSEGPICPQTDLMFGKLLQPQGMSESCIHANVHVPSYALPKDGKPSKGLPIFVQAHPGNFQFGAGDAGFSGPEFLVSRGIIVITFNIRLNVFGFMSVANSSSIPGNNGIRDIRTLLQWVRRNAAYFGGNPDEVTLSGNGVGSVCAHLLALSGHADGLFKRLILQSGSAMTPFFSYSRKYNQQMTDLLLGRLNITSTDPEKIHQQLIATEIDKIVEANKYVQSIKGQDVFVCVVEDEFPNVLRMVADNPINLLRNGGAKNIPHLVGFTNNELETFRNLYKAIDVASKIPQLPYIVSTSRLSYLLPNATLVELADKLVARFSTNGKSMTLDDFIIYDQYAFFARIAMKLANTRASLRHAPTYLYQFSYNSDHSVMKASKNISYVGAGQVEDYSYLFKTNSLLDVVNQRSKEDKQMVDWWCNIFVNFIKCSNPTCNKSNQHWPAVKAGVFKYQDVRTPGKYSFVDATKNQIDAYNIFDEYEPLKIKDKEITLNEKLCLKDNHF